MDFLDYFDSVQIINLPVRSDRREETEEEFKSHGFSIDCGKISFFPAVCPQDAAGFPSRGVRGCFLSHLAIIEDAIIKNLNTILILEDDIAFTRNIKKLGNNAVAELQELDWGIAYWGHLVPSNKKEAHWIKTTQGMSLSHFYAVNKRAFSPLVDHLNKILSRPPGHPDGGPMHYDGALSTFIVNTPEINVYFYSKSLGYQRPSRTDLHELSLTDKIPILLRGKNYLRKQKRRILKLLK